MLTIKSLISRFAKLPGLVANKVHDVSLIILDSDYLTEVGKSETGNYTIDNQTKRAYDKHRFWGRQALLCYAPFKNMYFGISGNVRTCCRNESYSFGSYPKQSIKEIWNGDKVQNLRRSIRNNDLSLGCDECYQHLVGGNFSAVVARMFDTQKMNRSYPSMMVFELDNTCNLECTICAGRLSSSIRNNREKLPPFKTPYDSDFVTQIEEFIPHLEEARFYGGEPFLIKLYYDIWEKMIRMNPRIKIYIQTNGTVLNDKIKNLLERGNFVINISVDAMNPQLFEKLRVNAHFETVMQNLMYFYQYSRRKNTFFCITPTLMRDNWQELPGLIAFCNSLNIPLFYNTLYRPKHLALYSLQEEELNQIANKLRLSTFNPKTKIQKQNLFYYNDFVDLVNRWAKEASGRKNKITEKMLPVVQAREQLQKKIHKHLLKEDNTDAANLLSENIHRVINLFDKEEEQAGIYMKLLEMPMQVVLEQVKAIEGMDDETIIKMIREYL